MFTGIIEETGRVIKIRRGSSSAQIDIQAEIVLKDVQTGDSIAVNGVCLTVTEHDAGRFTADVMPETLDKTSLSRLQPGSRVNLERAMRLGDRLGGHLVLGHVDGTGIILEKKAADIAYLYRISAPEAVMRYLVPKGSIAIDGTSLTVVDSWTDSFSVSLIPHTAGSTILGEKGPGDIVNLESDILGRYIEKLLGPGTDRPRSIDLNFLAENGYL